VNVLYYFSNGLNISLHEFAIVYKHFKNACCKQSYLLSHRGFGYRRVVQGDSSGIVASGPFRRLLLMMLSLNRVLATETDVCLRGFSSKGIADNVGRKRPVVAVMKSPNDAAILLLYLVVVVD
jgi:hypothetical protein